MTCLSLGLLAVVVFSVSQTGDYVIGGAISGDNAGPAIQALAHGSITGYLTHQPFIGLTSLVLRVPFAALAPALGGGNLLTYQLGALACMLPLALLAGWLVAARELPLGPRLFRLLAVLVVITSPILRQTVTEGHPEEVVAAVLGCCAVVAATRGQVRWSAVLLGLAIGTKEWAVIALPPVMIALPHRRREVGLIAGGLALVLWGAPWLADPAAFVRALHSVGGTRLVNPFSLLWPLGSPVHLPGGQLAPVRHIPLGLSRSAAAMLTSAVVAALLAGWYLRARRRGAACDPLALLALLGLLRCVCDTTHLEYYLIAALIPLAVWESMQDRPPLATIFLSVGGALLYRAVGHIPDSQVYLLSTAGELALVVYLGRQALARRTTGPGATAAEWGVRSAGRKIPASV